jgi:hypothetical protein
MPNKADSENDVILEMHHIRNYKEFSCIDVTMKIKIVRKQFLNKLQQNTRRHQKIGN